MYYAHIRDPQMILTVALCWHARGPFVAASLSFLGAKLGACIADGEGLNPHLAPQRSTGDQTSDQPSPALAQSKTA